MRRLLIVNNIPTPYRTFMFNKLFERGKDFGVEVKVAFQAKRQAHRPWRAEDFDMKFPYFISTGLKGKKGRPNELFKYTTVNRDIIAEVMSGVYDWVITAAFMCFNGWILSLMPLKAKKLLWAEGNFARAMHSGKVAKFVKRILASPYDALVCPGERAVEYINFLAPKTRNKPVLWLPNIVDVQSFKDRVDRLKESRTQLRQSLGIRDNELIVLGIGQLIPIKGFDALIRAAVEVKGRYRLCLAGDGSERALYEKIINQNALHNRVCLLGQLSEEAITRWLACADWFIHPARKDSSPLVVVEALNAGLPIAVSKNTGNGPEAVIENVNGFTFDQDNQQQVIEALERILDTPASSLLKMSQSSQEIAKNNFDPDIVADRFFKALLELTEAKHKGAVSCE